MCFQAGTDIFLNKDMETAIHVKMAVPPAFLCAISMPGVLVYAGGEDIFCVR